MSEYAGGSARCLAPSPLCRTPPHEHARQAGPGTGPGRAVNHRHGPGRAGPTAACNGDSDRRGGRADVSASRAAASRPAALPACPPLSSPEAAALSSLPEAAGPLPSSPTPAAECSSRACRIHRGHGRVAGPAGWQDGRAAGRQGGRAAGRQEEKGRAPLALALTPPPARVWPAVAAQRGHPLQAPRTRGALAGAGGPPAPYRDRAGMARPKTTTPPAGPSLFTCTGASDDAWSFADHRMTHRRQYIASTMRFHRGGLLRASCNDSIWVWTMKFESDVKYLTCIHACK